jgi:hypothetical protein
VFVTAWVAIALVFIGMNWKKQDLVPEIRPANLKAISPGAIAWVFASAVGIALTEQTLWPVVSQLTPLITMALAAGVYFAAYKLSPPRLISSMETMDPADEELDLAITNQAS